VRESRWWLTCGGTRPAGPIRTCGGRRWNAGCRSGAATTAGSPPRRAAARAGRRTGAEHLVGGRRVPGVRRVHPDAGARRGAGRGAGRCGPANHGCDVQRERLVALPPAADRRRGDARCRCGTSCRTAGSARTTPRRVLAAGPTATSSGTADSVEQREEPEFDDDPGRPCGRLTSVAPHHV
jgi:hypothetical protein